MRNEQILKELWGSIKKTNIQVMGVSEEEQKK